MSYSPVLSYPEAYRDALPIRQSLTKLTSLPPDASGWSPHVLVRPHQTNGQLIEGKFYRQLGNRAVCITDLDGSHLNEVIRDCIFNMRGNLTGRWGLRDYLTQGLVERVIFEHIKEEHGRYTHLAPGMTTYRDVLFHLCNSQGFQNRDELEFQSPGWNQERKLSFERVSAVECTTNRGTRPAFSISLKSAGPKSDFESDGLFVQTVQGPTFWYNNSPFNSYGAFCAELWRSVRLVNTQIELYRPRNTGLQFFDYGAKLVNDAGQYLPRRAPQFVELDGGHLINSDIYLRPEWHEQVRIRPGIQGNSRIKLFRWDKNPDGTPKLPSQGGTWRLYSDLPLGPGYTQG